MSSKRLSSQLSRSRRAFTLIELMIVVAIIGVLAAIAIPSFNKTVRRARTTEALISLRKLYDGSVAYYDADHTNQFGAVIPRQFPETNSLTPTAPPAGRKATPNPALWQQATWQALTFAVSDPHYFAYQYVSEGIDGGSRFQAIAQGNLDGDTIFSLFRRGGTIEGGEVRGWAGVYRERELE